MALPDRPLPHHHLCLLSLLLLSAVGLGSTKAESGATDGITSTGIRLKEEGPQPDSKPKLHSERPIANWTTNSSRTAFPCPEPAAIAPCTCTLNDNGIDLDCTEVESEEQLANVFQQEFPVKELHEFSMANNSAIRVFRNILNGVTFESISLSPGPFVLEQISDYLFLGIANTLQLFSIHESQLTSDGFPFAILSQMKELETIGIEDSLIAWIPPVTAPKLSFLSLVYGITDIVEAGTFPIHEWSTRLYLYESQIHSVEPGSYFFVDENSAASNSPLIIHFGGNQLQSLRTGTIPLRNAQVEVYLHNNRIVSIEPGTFLLPAAYDSLSLILWARNNQLTTFDEAVFGDVMPFITELSLQGNPLSCGCDIAWVVTNPDYMAAITDAAKCADGTLLSDLDPQYYLGSARVKTKNRATGAREYAECRETRLAELAA